MSAQSRLRDLLRDHVAPVLRARGFAGSGQDFHRQVEGNWAAINFQRDRYSTKAQLRFTVNLGTASTVVRVEDGFAPDEPAAEVDCHWRTRLGELLPPKRDLWWTVGADMTDADIARLGQELASHLADVAVPKLTEMATDEAILAAHLPAEPAAGLAPMSMDVIGPILRRLGPSPRFEHYLQVIDEDGATSASLYTMFDGFPPVLGPKRIAARLEKLSAKGFAPRQQAIMDLGYAPHSEEIRAAIRPFLDDANKWFRAPAAEALGRLGDRASLPRLLEMVRHDQARRTAVYAAFALARLDRAATVAERPQIRRAITERRERAVGHDRAALSRLLRQMAGVQGGE